MLLQEDLLFGGDDGQDFGILLKTLRSQRRVKQRTIVSLLPGWTPTSYTRLENGEIAPRFDQLLPIYRAFQQAGITFTLAARQYFIALAREKIKDKKTHRDIRTDAEWVELRYQLTRVDSLGGHHAVPDGSSLPPGVSRLLLAETSHLVGRESWRENIMRLLTESSPPKKMIIVRGPMGIGKSSELNWLAAYLLNQPLPSYQVLLCDFSLSEQVNGPEHALDVFLGMALTQLGYIQTQASLLSLEKRTEILLDNLEQAVAPVVMLIDGGECLLQEYGVLAPCWERFLKRFLRSQHKTTIVLATKQWPGWFGGEHIFVTEMLLPPLLQEQGVLLLQQLGLDVVPVPTLQDVYSMVGGIPLCLEWVAALVKQPAYVDDWEEFGMCELHGAAASAARTLQLTQAVQRLLAEPHVFGGNLADAVVPLLDDIITNQRLSTEAVHLLQVLSIALIPLAKPALEVVCVRGPYPIKELRRASLLVAYTDRVQLLPMAAAAVMRHLSTEQICEREETLIQAYTMWLQIGIFHETEKGTIITELAMLLLKHRHLLAAAQLLIRYGWLSFNLGHAIRLAHQAEAVMQQFDWRAHAETLSGGVLLHSYLSPFLGKTPNVQEQVAGFQRLLDLVRSGTLLLQPPTDVYITRQLMVSYMNELRFEEAQELLNACNGRLASHLPSDVDVQTSLLEKRALLFGTWSEFAQEQGKVKEAEELRQHAITLYRECSLLLQKSDEASPLLQSVFKKRLARYLNDLGYHLNRLVAFTEALQVLGQSIALKEQGLVEPGSLAASYGEKSQALAGIGRFQEALIFDEKALAVVQRLAHAGHTPSQEEEWIYLVNRGRLYLQLGRADEAEHFLRDALPHIHPRRRMYRVFAQNALDEIQQGRLASTSRQYQMDWRWIERFRQLSAFNSFWWLAHAGPFTESEQQEWERLSFQETDDTKQKCMETILAQSRQRELEAAIAEEREPRLWYPAIPIDDVRARIAALLQLDEEVRQGEPNAVVRRFYEEAIAEQISFIRLIEATYEGDSKTFRELNSHLHAEPTIEEMTYALSRVKRVLKLGLTRPKTAEISRKAIELFNERVLVPFDPSSEQEEQEIQDNFSPSSAPHVPRQIPARTSQKFFDAILREHGYEGWRVVLDHTAQAPRIEQGLRQFILPAQTPLSVDQVREYLSHELGGHVSRSVAGERSTLGLLGIGTNGSLATEEGLALYFDRQTATVQGKRFDESRLWLGTLATGMASGVLTSPQKFLSLYTFFASFLLLYRLLWRSDEDLPTAEGKAQAMALARCLRTYRGVPDLMLPGVCYSKDALYLRGYWLISATVSKEESVLDHLAVGVVALQQLPELQELGLVAPSQPLRKLALDPDLASRILSFADADDDPLTF